jgi:hypothetical protein
VTPLCYLKNGRTARENETGTTPYFNKSEKELWKCAEMLDWYGTQQTDWLIRELHGHAYRRTTRENKIRDRFTRVLV